MKIHKFNLNWQSSTVMIIDGEVYIFDVPEVTFNHLKKLGYYSGLSQMQSVHFGGVAFVPSPKKKVTKR